MKRRIKTPKARITWGFNPVSRVVPSKRGYSRNKAKHATKNIITEELR